MTANEAFETIEKFLTGGFVGTGDIMEARGVLRAVVEDYEKARPLLYAASNMPKPWGGWELCDDVQLLIDMALDYQKQGRGRKP